MANEYYKDPKTAVIEGISSALATIVSNRAEVDAPDMNLTNDEIHIMEDEITHYILSRFNLTFKD